MITYSVIKENILKSFKRSVKVVQYGAKTADVASSFGDDASPLKGMIALYSGTSENGDNIIIGYLNENQIAKEGEKRIFSLKADGSKSFDIYLKNDETCEIGGDADNAVRFSKLEEGFNQLKSDLNSLIASYNLHQHTAPNGATPPTTQGVASNASITAAKIEEIKVP